MRLIDADALVRSMSVRLKELADECGWYDHYVTGLDDAITYIDDAPTIDAAPVVHARWLEDHMDYRCSACRATFHDDMFWIQGDCITPKYCPECGARMDEKEVLEDGKD